MELSQCNWVNVKIVSICAPNLRSLSIIDETFVPHWNESDSCQIMIFGNFLKLFKYHGDFLNDYCFYDSSSLDEVHVEVDYVGERSRIVAYRSYKLLRGISDVNKLVLSDVAIEVLDHAMEVLVRLPLFNNLSYLTMDTEAVYLDCKALLKMLQNSPCLEVLKFSGGVNLSPDYEKAKGIMDPVPPCFLTHLKEITFYEFSGDKEQYIDVVEIFLHGAVVLDKLAVFCGKSVWPLEEFEEVHKQLLELPRASGVLVMTLI
ncbi:F-box/LRR-repeat protein [Tripterygium wilfordii]|uniref:F-box/LRR-repeat protein n=1 Tax=Tripterygium wilfordii TaxID=458696 RepID=A0A7J7C421_TRIWF|nr:F-box/LRR-repeat protein [Tripterygium wilfordii]